MNPTTSSKLNIYISKLLRIGVYLSVTLVVIGTILSILHKEPFSYKSLSEINTKTNNYFLVFYNDLLQGQSTSILLLGIIIILLTPVLRLLFALLGFLWQKDYLYAIITISVLSIMGLSLYLGATH